MTKHTPGRWSELVEREAWSKHQTIQAMIRYGGSFVQALGRAALLADDENFRRIRATWPEYWDKYAEMARTEP